MRRGGGTYVDTLVRKTRRHGGALFFGFAQEDGEVLNGGHGNVPAIVAGQEGLYSESIMTAVYGGKRCC